MDMVVQNNSALGGMGSMLSSKASVYGYSNARVHAMRPALLSRRQAEDLLKVQTNAAVIEYLSRTAYHHDFSGLPPKATEEERVELAISRNFARAAQKLLRITPKQSKMALAAFLGRYDIHNIKTILLARKLGKTKEETLPLLVPAGSIKQEELSEMLSAKSADELYEAMRGNEFGSRFFGSASIRGIPKDQIKALFQNPASETAKLELFLSALDFYYYEMASLAIPAGEKDAKIISELIQSEADAKNMITAMRLKKTGADKATIMRHMVRGGNFPRATLERLASAKDIGEIAAMASDSFTHSQTGKAEFAAAEQSYKNDGQLSHFEVVFERSIARRSLKALHRSILSIGAIVGFLFLKEEEMNNIKKIARGKALRLPSEKISEMLIFV